MSADEQIPVPAEAATATEPTAEQERSEKILKAKELYSHGSRNFLVKCYAEAADELSQVCGIYEDLYGELSDELGMPYLLYAKSLIALALDENKVIDVPDEEEDDEDDDEEGEANGENDESEAEANGEVAAASSSTNGASKKLDSIKETETEHENPTASDEKSDEADSTADASEAAKKKPAEKVNEDAEVSSTDEKVSPAKTPANGNANGSVPAVADGEKPSTSNGDTADGTDNTDKDEADDENEAASSLQLAWEILELAAKIFSRQGMGGLPNLAEVQTELGNIEFENNILDAAREDYEKALKIYADLPAKSYRRAMAEIHYKIGLTYLMDQLNKEGAESLKVACSIIDSEIDEIKAKKELTEKEQNNIQDLEETKQEIWAKIAEIEETQAQQVAEVRAALDNYITPIGSSKPEGAGTSSSSAAASGSGASSSAISSSSSSSKPNDISHLIKRKKPEETNSEAEALESPAKRPAL